MIQKIFIAAVLFSITLHAHQLKENYLQVDLNDTTHLVDVNLEVETRLLERNSSIDDNQNGIISYKELRNHKSYLLSYVKDHFKLFYEDKPLSIDDAKIEFHRYQSQTYMSVNKSFKDIGLDGLRLDYDMFFKIEPTNKLIIHLDKNRGDAILDNSNTSYAFSSGDMSQWKRFYIFLVEGIKHILDGTDHMLFIFMLLIPSAIYLRSSKNRQSLKKSIIILLKIVTAFSIAHSLTLFISGMGWYKPNIALVESSIALSILVVALLNFFGQYKHVNYKIVFLFGLLHGFGFANVLEIAHVNNTISFLIALFGFNVGVEIGQIFIIMLIIPFLYLTCHTKYFVQAVRVISFLAICISSFWFLQRVGLL